MTSTPSPLLCSCLKRNVNKVPKTSTSSKRRFSCWREVEEEAKEVHISIQNPKLPHESTLGKGTCYEEQDRLWWEVESVSTHTSLLADIIVATSFLSPYTVGNIFVFFPTHSSTLVDFSIFWTFDSHDLLTTFADDKDGDSSIMDFAIHCLHYDDIVHKEDSMRYRVFLTTGFFVSFYWTPPPTHTSLLHVTYYFFSFAYLVYYKIYIFLGWGKGYWEGLHGWWKNQDWRIQNPETVLGVWNPALFGYNKSKVG